LGGGGKKNQAHKAGRHWYISTVGGLKGVRTPPRGGAKEKEEKIKTKINYKKKKNKTTRNCRPRKNRGGNKGEKKKAKKAKKRGKRIQKMSNSQKKKKFQTTLKVRRKVIHQRGIRWKKKGGCTKQGKSPLKGKVAKEGTTSRGEINSDGELCRWELPEKG